MSETIGLDIGSHSIKLVGLKMTSKGPFLTSLGIREVPPRGDKEELGYLGESLKALLREEGLKPGKVSLTVSGSGVNLSRIAIPSMSKAELKEAVRWEIKGHLPFPIETARIDFHILKEFVEDNVKKLDLIVVACPNHLIDRTLSIAEGAGLQPTHLDVAPFALWNTVKAWHRFEKEEVVALIDLGAEKTGIHLFQDGILQFSREVTPAGADITRAIMEGTGPEEDPDLVYERAERIKQRVGILLEGDQEKMVDESINLSKISFLVRPVLERLVAEIGRSLDYYRNQFHRERIDRVLLTGGGANLKNITSYLAGELRLPVECFNPLQEILFDSKQIDVQVLDRVGPMLTVAIGVALPEPRRVELLPAKEPFLSRIRLEKSIAILVPLVTLLVFLWIVWEMNKEVSHLQKERDGKIAKITKIETLQAKLALLKEKEKQIKQDLSQFPTSMIGSVPHQKVLREASQIVPDNVTLRLLSVQNKMKAAKGESPTDAERELHLTGLAFGSDIHCLTALAQIIEGLEKSPLFKNARLMSADENKLYTKRGTEFEIVCDINLPGPKREERR